ncbi:hypothetical protein CEXT_259391 [Caerostris extrusa]|uniref:Uncharacterized protein n=1 Tax=Caerostris extrusa TaxID=172846 RepID=A0AAV4M458_CAEEX|nr:hypothetical protein CEXT_259391 [Caerostris extrusa]
MTETSFCLLIHNPCSRTHVLRALFAWRKIKDFSAFYFNELMRNDISIELLIPLSVVAEEGIRAARMGFFAGDRVSKVSLCVKQLVLSAGEVLLCGGIGLLGEWYTKNNCSMTYC